MEREACPYCCGLFTLVTQLLAEFGIPASAMRRPPTVPDPESAWWPAGVRREEDAP